MNYKGNQEILLERDIVQEIDEAVIHRLRETELEILDVIAELCERNKITWFLDSGTALGALRHKGFIPWDDDIDIGMLRKDYDRFLEIADSYLPDGYSLHTPENTNNYACHWAKLYKDGTQFVTRETLDAGSNMGIFVDIIPYDALASAGSARKRQLSLALRNTRLLYLYHSKYITVPHKGILGKLEKAACYVAHYFVRFFSSPKMILERFSLCVKMGNTEERQPPKQYLCLAYPYITPLEMDDLVPTKTALFEGRVFPVPGNTDVYLAKLYGNWRELPPLLERRTHMPIKLVFSPEEEPYVCP